MSAVGEADALLSVILDRVGGDDFLFYVTTELEEDLWEVRRLLEPQKDTTNGD